MRSIEQISLGLLALSLLFLGLGSAVVVLDRYTTQPPIYKVQQSTTALTQVQMVRGATNLEGLKKICEFWAERDDQLQAYVSAQSDQHLLMIREGFTAVLILIAIFGAGLLYIYLTARRARLANADAL